MNRMKANKLIYILVIFGLTGCDPVHTLYIENQTNENIFLQTKKDGKYDMLSTGSKIKIGNCVAHYNPRVDDIETEYLKIVLKSDTTVLTGKIAIFSMLQKVGKLNWKIIFRDK